MNDDAATLRDHGLDLLAGRHGRARAAEGAGWLQRAADAGDARACAALAVLSATGTCRPQDWTAALDGLQRAAELGWQPAARELALLASPTAPADGSPADPRTRHAGLAPTRGEKWLLSQWIRDRSPAA